MLIEVNRTEEEGKKEYKVTPKVSVQENKAVTVDVSEYTEPVEILPPEGKVAMEKVTVSLSNMPAGANMLYAWQINSGYYIYISANIAPADSTEANATRMIVGDFDTATVNVEPLVVEDETYIKVSDTEFTISYEDDGQTVTTTYTRDATKDIEIWNAPPEVETTKQATIDVSTYDPSNKPVITPTAGKQSMAEVEITLDNIPSGGSATAYAWEDINGNISYFDFDIAPNDITGHKRIYGSNPITISEVNGNGYHKISDTEFHNLYEEESTMTRDSTSDFTLWEISEG